MVRSSRNSQSAAAGSPRERSDHLTYLGLGSNLDDPQRQLESAIEAIRQLPRTKVLRRSPMYVSQPWGKLDQPDFLNMVVEVRTSLAPDSLLRYCKEIEAEHGRLEGERWGPRQLDIDILILGDRVIHTPTLEVPHARMWERAFVLRPLADLRPDLKSPDGTPITELLRRERIASQGVWPYEKIETRIEK
jgi:2-amino-4-hydroxy-6-hydroxymethyldihydropteridine diphosphokinase